MPIYEYHCAKCDQTIEVIQKMSDKPLKKHEGCGGMLTKLISAAGFQFKGTGWYVTDYARKSSGEKTETATETKTESKGTSTNGSKESSSGSTSGGTAATEEAKPEKDTQPKPSTSHDEIPHNRARTRECDRSDDHRCHEQSVSKQHACAD